MTKYKFLQRIYVHEGCWLWTGPPDTNGYGTLKYEGKKIGAHVASWLLHFGPTNGLFVLHKCDRRRCVNPEHLFLGTQKDNMEDCSVKGRIVSNGEGGQTGSEHHQAKTNEETIRKVKLRLAAGIFVKTVAREFGLSEAVVFKIKQGKRWKHV